MIPTSTREIAEQLKGAHHGPECRVDSVAIHSDQVAEGGLFVALAGQRADGHDFVARLLDRPGVAALISQDIDTAGTRIQVDNCQAALAALGRWHYAKVRPITVALTGSAGKTTTRQCVYSILSELGTCVASEQNYNNHLGVPLTLLRVNETTQWLVLEVGANAEGEVANLVSMVECEVAILTNALEAHLEGFGNLQGVARAKGEIIEGVVPDGTVVLNRDDDFFGQWSQRSGNCQVLSFGFSSEADISVKNLRSEALEQQQFSLTTPWGNKEIHLHLPGRHNVANAMAAAGACLTLGADLDQVATGLDAVRAVSGRSQLLKVRGGVQLLDDCYNANPGSVRAAIDIAAQYSQGNRWLVLGSMGELGEQSAQLHRQTGAYAAQAGLSGLAALGEYAEEVTKGFGEGAVRFADREAVLEWLLQNTKPNDLVVVKGSRSMGMETIVQALMNQNGE